MLLLEAAGRPAQAAGHVDQIPARVRLALLVIATAACSRPPGGTAAPSPTAPAVPAATASHVEVRLRFVVTSFDPGAAFRISKLVVR